MRSKNLTKRQIEVIKARCSGWNSKQVAVALGISLKTAEFHWTSAQRIIRVYGVAPVTLWALAHKLIENPFLKKRPPS